jgi:hypothetical protein
MGKKGSYRIKPAVVSGVKLCINVITFNAARLQIHSNFMKIYFENVSLK